MAAATDDETDDQVIDGALARRVTGGDADAEAALCRRLHPRVRAWGLKHARDEAVALDLAQHVVVAVIEALRAGRVDEPDRIGAFVLGTCKHVWSAWRRGEQRHAGLLARFGDLLAAAPEPRAAGIDQRRLAHCFGQLAPRARVVLALAFFAERSADAIAAELATTAGNVRVVRHRALAQLQQCMEAS